MWTTVLVSGISLGSFYILIALGFALIFGVTRYFNLAHGELVVLAGYVAYWLWDGYGLSFVLTFPIAILVMLLICLGLKRLFARLSEPLATMRIETTPKVLVVGAGAAGLAASLALAGCGEEQAQGPAAVDVEAGKAFVQAHCTGCHTLDGGGKTSEIPNLAGQPQEYLVSAMNAYRDGSRHHSALQDLISGTSDEEVRNIAAYFADLPPVQAEPPSPAAM